MFNYPETERGRKPEDMQRSVASRELPHARGRGVKIVIFMTLRCKVMKNPRKTEGAWGKSFSGPPRGPEEQRTYEQGTRLEFADRPLDIGS